MAKKAKGNRVQVILECTEHKDSGMPGKENRRNTSNRRSAHLQQSHQNCKISENRRLCIQRRDGAERRCKRSSQ